jgi:hypothetical protein
MRWRGRVPVAAAVVVLMAVGCGRFGRGSGDDTPVGVGDGIDVPTLKPTVTFETPGVPVTTAAGSATTTPAAGGTVSPPATVAGPSNPCAGTSTRAGPDNVAEGTDANGLVVRITVAPSLCFRATDEITVAVDVANRGTESRYHSSRKPVSVVFVDHSQTVVWSSCTHGRSVSGGPPDVPIEVPPGEDTRVQVLTYKSTDARCGTVPVGIHTAVASVLTCTAADAGDGVCDENALVPIASPGLRFEVR